MQNFHDSEFKRLFINDATEVAIPLHTYYCKLVAFSKFSPVFPEDWTVKQIKEWLLDAVINSGEPIFVVNDSLLSSIITHEVFWSWLKDQRVKVD